jgi:hypothetical protein
LVAAITKLEASKTQQHDLAATVKNVQEQLNTTLEKSEKLRRKWNAYCNTILDTSQ